MNTCPWCGQFSKNGELCSRRCALEFERQDPDGYRRHGNRKLYGCFFFVALVGVGILAEISKSPVRDDVGPKAVDGVPVRRATAVIEGEGSTNASQTQFLDISTDKSNDSTLPARSKISDSERLGNGTGDVVTLEDVKGRVIKAKIMAVTGKTVVFRRIDGKNFELDLTELSEDSKRTVNAFRQSRYNRGSNSLNTAGPSNSSTH